MKELRRPPLTRSRTGITLAALAADADMPRETLVALLKHHGYLELAPYGREQSRHLLTDASFHAGIGHNVQPGEKLSVKLDGMNRVAPFPVIYPEAVSDILWTLDWQGVCEAFGVIVNKRQRIAVAVSAFGYLPDAALAILCGCTSRGIEKARSRGQAPKVHFQLLNREPSSHPPI